MGSKTGHIIEFSEYLKSRFGDRVWRVPLDAGLTCPNRDGTLGDTGCIYCDNRSFHATTSPAAPISRQLQDGIDRVAERRGIHKVLAYYQTYTNTHAPVDHLKSLYQPAIDHDTVVAIAIGTRPDCLPEPVIRLLADINRKKPVWIELGIQTIHDATLRAIRRGHTWTDASDAIDRLQAAGIDVAAHVILGLPGESAEDMIATARTLASKRLLGIKLHHLHAIRGTILHEMLERHEWTPMDVDTYIRIAARFLSVFHEPVVVMRWVGDCRNDLLIAPRWTRSKTEIRNAIITSLMELS